MGLDGPDIGPNTGTVGDYRGRWGNIGGIYGCNKVVK